MEDNELRQLCDRLKQENMELTSRVIAAETAKKEAEDNLYKIKGSTAWKLTKPLRAVRNFGRKLSYYRTPARIAARVKYKKAEKKAYKLLGTESFPNEDQRREQEETEYSSKVVFSILVPLYNTPEKYLRDMIESVLYQTYKDWQLCLADGSDADHEYVGRIAREYADKDTRIVYRKLEKNEGISGNTNKCLALASGDYIGLFDHDDILHPCALFEYRRAVDDGADYIYCDEVTFEGDSVNNMITLHFKPDYAIDTLRANNYICHFSVFKKTLLSETQLFRTEYDGSQDHDMILRLTSLANKVTHVKGFLYYWRSHAGSVASDINVKPYCIDSAKRAVLDHLEGYGIYNTVITSTRAFETLFQLNYAITTDGVVSVVIPCKDNGESLRKCIDSIKRNNKFDFERLDIVIVDNDSTDETTLDFLKTVSDENNIRVIKYSGAFNKSKMVNAGARAAKGEFLLILNPEVRMESMNYINELLMYVQRRDIGIAGPKLLFDNDDIEHAGIIIGLGPDRVAGHIQYQTGNAHIGYMGRLCYAQNISAVSGASMMIKKSDFLDNGGFDENMMYLADVDLCLKLRRKGRLNIFTPFAVGRYNVIPATHGGIKESEKERYDAECKVFKERYAKELEEGDPYYNPYFSLDRYDYALKEL